jgi:hypothetical protein
MIGALETPESTRSTVWSGARPERGPVRARHGQLGLAPSWAMREGRLDRSAFS